MRSYANNRVSCDGWTTARSIANDIGKSTQGVSYGLRLLEDEGVVVSAEDELWQGIGRPGKKYRLAV